MSLPQQVEWFLTLSAWTGFSPFRPRYSRLQTFRFSQVTLVLFTVISTVPAAKNVYYRNFLLKSPCLLNGENEVHLLLRMIKLATSIANPLLLLLAHGRLVKQANRLLDSLCNTQLPPEEKQERGTVFLFLVVDFLYLLFPMMFAVFGEVDILSFAPFVQQVLQQIFLILVYMATAVYQRLNRHIQRFAEEPISVKEIRKLNRLENSVKKFVAVVDSSFHIQNLFFFTEIFLYMLYVTILVLDGTTFLELFVEIGVICLVPFVSANILVRKCVDLQSQVCERH